MILVSGCFDGVHAGHVRYLEAAAAVDPMHKLIVAIAPDAYVLTHKKQLRWCWTDRIAVVTALKVVDGYLVHDDESVASVITALRPRYFVKGEDWATCLPADVLAACQDTGTEIRFVPDVGGHNVSTYGQVAYGAESQPS